MEQNSRATQLAELIEQQPRARFKGGQHLCASLQFDHLLTGNRLLVLERMTSQESQESFCVKRSWFR